MAGEDVTKRPSRADDMGQNYWDEVIVVDHYYPISDFEAASACSVN